MDFENAVDFREVDFNIDSIINTEIKDGKVYFLLNELYDYKTVVITKKQDE